jgi:hypothetical protein
LSTVTIATAVVFFTVAHSLRLQTQVRSKRKTHKTLAGYFGGLQATR